MALFGGGSDQQLNITLKAKDEATATINKVRLSIGDIAKGSAIGALAVQGLSTAFRFLEGVVTSSIHEFEQQQQAVAQLNAVLASTQHAAGMTAQEVVDLSNALSKGTLYQDDMVLSAENLILTFTNITKEIFPQTTQAVLDMSTALGQDLKSSAIQLGKALNNPIEGVSALQRVGVAFNNSQQDLIATMVKSGHTMDAQKYILAEIQREFGGSAKSAYESASSITKLQKSVKDLEQGIGSGLTPVMNNLFSAFANVSAGMGKNIDVGLLVFKSFRTITEAAIALGDTLNQVSLGIAATLAQTRRFFDSVSLFSKENKKQRLADDDAQIASLGNISNASSKFLDDFVASNEAVIASWGQSSIAAKQLGKSGPAAYQATATEAKAATDAIKKTEQAIASTRDVLAKFKDDLMGDTTDLATAFADQEKKIADMKKELADRLKTASSREDVEAAGQLNVDILKEQAALDKNRTIETQLPGQVAKARVRIGETDFERSVEDIQTRIVEQQKSFQQTVVNLNFNDAVVGDDGIQKIIS
jgi:hypothetical protein